MLRVGGREEVARNPGFELALTLCSKASVIRGKSLNLWVSFFAFRLKLKKVGKTTRPFRYDLNQIPYN